MSGLSQVRFRGKLRAESPGILSALKAARALRTGGGITEAGLGSYPRTIYCSRVE